MTCLRRSIAVCEAPLGHLNFLGKNAMKSMEKVRYSFHAGLSLGDPGDREHI